MTQFPNHAPPRNRFWPFLLGTLGWTALCGAALSLGFPSYAAGLTWLVGFVFISGAAATGPSEAKTLVLYTLATIGGIGAVGLALAFLVPL